MSSNVAGMQQSSSYFAASARALAGLRLLSETISTWGFLSQLAVCAYQQFLEQVLGGVLRPGKPVRETVQPIEMRPHDALESLSVSTGTHRLSSLICPRRHVPTDLAV